MNRQMPALRNIGKTMLLLLLGLSCVCFTAEAQQKKAKPKPKSKAKTVYRGKTAYRKKPAARPVMRPVAPAVAVSNPNVVRTQAAFTFTNRWHDFGDIVQGQKVTHTFTFRNTGKDPLVIYSVQPTCGCTVTEWSREPVPPGAGSTITVIFDSKSALNQQNKTVTILSNAVTGSERLYLKGNVLPKR